MTKQESVQYVIDELERLYPETPIPLDHEDEYTLLIAVLLSAQCTDARVNTITPILFAKAEADLASAWCKVTLFTCQIKLYKELFYLMRHGIGLIGLFVFLNTMAKLKLDLHEIYNKGNLIDIELNNIINEAIEKKINMVEIIPGKGSGQLKKKVIRFLEQKHIKAKYHRLDKDSKNFGRLFLRFKFK